MLILVLLFKIVLRIICLSLNNLFQQKIDLSFVNFENWFKKNK